MEFSEAIDWVKRNERLIRKTIGKYYLYSPYEEADYMQDAFESAIGAVIKSQRKSLPFEPIFWQDFRKNLSIVTPNTNSPRYGSNSVPTFLCCEEMDIAAIAQSEELPEFDMEAIYNRIDRYLTERERAVLTLALGLTPQGTLSNYEIAECLNCSTTNVRDAYSRAFCRIRRLVDEGVINPEELGKTARNTAQGGLCDDLR